MSSSDSTVDHLSSSARRSGRLRKVILIGAAVIATLATSASATPLASSAPDAPVELPESSVPGLGFDPYVEALGVTTLEELATLKDAQTKVANESGAGLGASGGPHNSIDSPELLAAREAVGLAMDDLYARIASDPEYDRFRQQWRDCMSSLGTPAQSPAEVEARVQETLSEPATLEDEIAADPSSGNAVQRSSVARSRDACDAALADELDTAVKTEYPSWSAEHQETFATYRRLMDDVAD